ncbi:MAG: hypothetical protein R6U98_19040, partial [Pirellulaceae bacterium]
GWILDRLSPNRLSLFPGYAGLPQQLLEHTSSLLGGYTVLDHLAIPVYEVSYRLVCRLDRLPEPHPRGERVGVWPGLDAA